MNELKFFIFFKGWYSTGSYYWSRTIVELVPTLITIWCYIYICDIYNGNTIFLGYLYFLTIGVLCVQSLGHLIGIILCDNAKIAAFVSVNVFVLLLLFANFMIPIKELHYTLQWLSNLSTHKLIFESMIILLYGFDRCADRQFSGILYVFDVDDNDFFINAWILIFQFIFLRSLALIALIVKTNSFVKKIDNLLVETPESPNGNISGLSSHYEFKIESKQK